jgi:hypothetical protein
LYASTSSTPRFKPLQGGARRRTREPGLGKGTKSARGAPAAASARSPALRGFLFQPARLARLCQLTLARVPDNRLLRAPRGGVKRGQRVAHGRCARARHLQASATRLDVRRRPPAAFLLRLRDLGRLLLLQRTPSRSLLSALVRGVCLCCLARTFHRLSRSRCRATDSPPTRPVMRRGAGAGCCDCGESLELAPLHVLAPRSAATVPGSNMRRAHDGAPARERPIVAAGQQLAAGARSGVRAADCQLRNWWRVQVHSPAG